MEDETARAADAGRSGPETAILALAGAAAGACVVALLIAAGGFAAWAGPARPPRPDLLAWAAGDVRDDRIDFLVYRVGIAVAGGAALAWCLTGLRRSVPRSFTMVPAAALVAAALPWIAGRPGLAVPVAATCVAACIAALVAGLRSPRRATAAGETSDAARRVRFGWPDLLVVAGIVVVFAPGDSGRLAAELLREDQFHHWDVFAVGPAIAARGGWTPGSDVPLMYGFGPPAAIDAAASALGGLTHEHALDAAAWFETTYLLVLFAGLRLLGLRTGSAALVLAAAVSVERFRLIQYAPHDLMRYPAGSVLRFFFDAPWLALVAWHAAGGRRGALACAGLVAGAAVWWVTDTGIFLVMGHAAVVAFLAWRAAPEERSGIVVAGAAPVLAVALTVALCVPGALALDNLWEQIALRTAGYAAFPVPALDPENLGVYAAPLVFAALGAAAVVRRSPLAPVAAGWALYAAGCYHYYVGRSLLSSWARLAIVIAVACALLYLLCRRGEAGAAGDEASDIARRRRHLGVAASLGAVAICLATPRLVVRVTDRLDRGTPAVAGRDVDPVIPASADAAVAEALTSGIAGIRRLVPAGSAAAVISDYDVIYCLGADRRPFSPRLPLLHMTLTTAQLEDARKRLDDPAVEYVFVDATRPRFHWSRELVPVLREHVATTCELVGRAGDLEVWRRRSAR